MTKLKANWKRVPSGGGGGEVACLSDPGPESRLGRQKRKGKCKDNRRDEQQYNKLMLCTTSR